MLTESSLSPRTAFSLTLDADGRSLIKGGWGLFFDQVFLQADAFDQFQQRIEQGFNGTEAAPAGPPVVFENRVDPEGLEEPTSIVWNIEFDQQLGESLLLRVNYRENRARDRLVIDRVTDSAGSALVLSSTGRLTGREFDATIRWTLANRGDLFVSFSKIRTKGNREEPRGIETNSLDLFEAVMEKPRSRYAPFVTRAAYNFGLHSVREMEAAHADVSV